MPLFVEELHTQQYDAFWITLTVTCPLLIIIFAANNVDQQAFAFKQFNHVQDIHSLYKGSGGWLEPFGHIQHYRYWILGRLTGKATEAYRALGGQQHSEPARGIVWTWYSVSRFVAASASNS